MLFAVGVYAVIVVSVLLLLRMLALPGRSMLLFVPAVIGLCAGLAIVSPSRALGDSDEHLAMASAIAHGSAPAAQDGREPPRRSWLYALIAAPLVRAAEAVGANPASGFTVLNIVLLAAAGALVARRISIAAAVLLTAGPVLWWVDKPHPEVFTFSLITIAVALIGTAPWWSIVALGAAAAQEPPIALAMLAAIVFSAVRAGIGERRLWMAAAAGLAMAALNPLYPFVWRGGAARALFDVDVHLPLARELLSTPFDPNIGIFTHAPLLTAAILVALVLALIRSPRQVFTLTHAGVLVMGALFVVAFTQMTNINSGGTPGPSRYGLWLLPIAIPVLEAAPPAATLRVLAAASMLWSMVWFAPSRPENYLRPTRLAAALWQRWPAADNPLVEVFAERVSGSEPAPQPPLATPGCEKVLIVGRGSGSPTQWPGRCTPETAPPFCREVDVLCYANRTSGTYAFTRLPVLNTWTPEQSMPHASRADPIAVAPDDSREAFDAVALAAGWSYLEELPERDIRWRWMNDQGELGIAAREAVPVRLRVDARAHGRPRRIRLSTAAGDVATWNVPAERTTFETGDFQLPAGPSVIRFDSLDGADPAGGGDPRRLSIAVFGVRVLVAR